MSMDSDYKRRILQEYAEGRTIVQLIAKYSAASKFEIVDALMEHKEPKEGAKCVFCGK